ncbi:MAG: hypothetical protein ABTQ73_07895 [Caldilineales bacterium]
MQRLEQQWTAGKVVTLDVMEAPIRQFGAEVGFEVTPTFILFDPQGRELKRWTGRIPTVGELQTLTP